jgi:predicted GTPase
LQLEVLGVTMKRRFDCIILGAGGRDFHDFLTFFRDNPSFHVRAFTATQIPFIAQRTFPRALAGPAYPEDIPIYPEEQIPELLRRDPVDMVFLAYSDLPHAEVMHKAALVQSHGASFVLLGPRHTQLRSRRPVIAVTAVRTGAGKSPISQAIARHLHGRGIRVGVVRHPMPYGVLEDQLVERFSTAADLDRFACTIEEREEYTPYIEHGLTVYAGVDYARILELAESESEVLLWDGGNNDFPFLRPDLSIVVVDALRPGHEVSYHPGETNFRAADVLVLNKVAAASQETMNQLRARAHALNPGAEVLEADLDVTADDPEAIAGRRVLVIEDGPTTTHGGMAHGAGFIAARRAHAREIVDPRPFAVGSVAEAYRNYPHVGPVLPALGYSAAQLGELAATIRAAAPEVVVDASPARMAGTIGLGVPVVAVRYSFHQVGGRDLLGLVDETLARLHRRPVGNEAEPSAEKEVMR